MTSNQTPFEKWEQENKDQVLGKKEDYSKKTIGSPTRPWDILNPNIEKSTKDLAEKRYDICLDCPMLIQISKQCRKCGCFMAVKTKIKESVCPIGKW